MNELIELWRQVVGGELPDRQWALWQAPHGVAVIRQGILAAARKNLSQGGNMPQENLVRFASAVMLTKDQRDAEHAANRVALDKEFGGAQ